MIFISWEELVFNYQLKNTVWFLKKTSILHIIILFIFNFLVLLMPRKFEIKSEDLYYFHLKLGKKKKQKTNIGVTF